MCFTIPIWFLYQCNYSVFSCGGIFRAWFTITEKKTKQKIQTPTQNFCVYIIWYISDPCDLYHQMAPPDSTVNRRSILTVITRKQRRNWQKTSSNRWAFHFVSSEWYIGIIFFLPPHTEFCLYLLLISQCCLSLVLVLLEWTHCHKSYNGMTSWLTQVGAVFYAESVLK